jgi:Uma2 family endonuclease
MTNQLASQSLDAANFDISQIVTEDDEPVDNIASAKLQRFLVHTLYSSQWTTRPFVADANVGIFSTPRQPPIVPDVFISFDVAIAEDWWAKAHRSYFIWEYGKPPDVALEIVSNTEGNEAGRKLHIYAQMGVRYYVIYDPQQLILDEVLQVYELDADDQEYFARLDYQLPAMGLGLTLWEGEFEGRYDQWLRWSDSAGNLLPTGAEYAEQERARADRLAAQLRALGIEPDQT